MSTPTLSTPEPPADHPPDPAVIAEGEATSPDTQLQSVGCPQHSSRPNFPQGDPAFTPYAAMYDLMSTKRDTEPSELPPQESRIPIDATESFPISSDAFEGRIVVIHRPPDPNSPFPYYGYMGKKRRRWELRWQGRFKIKPSSALFFGIEATQPLPELGFVAKSGIRLVLSIATRLAAARGTMLLTNYPNSDPSRNTFFTFPLVSADTCIVSDLDTPPNQLPDITADKALTGKVTHDYLFDTEHIYTFCYYSMYIDFVTWDLRNLPVVSGTSLCTFTGHQPIHVIIKDQEDDYFMDVLIAHRCLSPVWADYIVPDESTGVLSLTKRMSSSTDSMEFVSCHSYSWEDGSGSSSSSSNEVVSVVEVVDVIDKKGDNGKTDKVLVTRKVKMRKRDVVLSPFRLAKKAWSRAFMPCYPGRPSGMRRSRSLSMLGTVSEPRPVKHHQHDDNNDSGNGKVTNRRVSDNTDNVSRRHHAASSPSKARSPGKSSKSKRS
ncbi:hypothetical protein Pmar_PMAR012712 [Perkinsus marinus ATCC 50983]|uniref:Domain of unknown function at the cortex 1 domain-containing protein n=1 Tax=Perkinsus marinus (strain ATCC 50983 / TXsc) TaxID=423536 RepID=C5K839_PERM5|nr:hypothetical protein Pmar_PMAR012712 [Perkinsus marinus ATCC 50983]EER19724.1 hypothetical protein Pmar_PMAR012712 [Perkinsus marinus ATCC 50983]|eukprot:XP_002787928.1 hypothetical protein Pmar_PMAR012712 [Perkinsus marinus ATCC 50983]